MIWDGDHHTFGYYFIAVAVAIFGHFPQSLISLAILFSVIFAIQNIGMEEIKLDSTRKKIADANIAAIIREIGERRGHLYRVALIHFSNDPTNYFTDTLRNEINRSGVLCLSDKAFTEKIKEKLRVPLQGAETREEALQQAGKRHIDGIFWGRIDVFEKSGKQVLLEGRWELLDPRTGQAVAEGQLKATPVVKNLAWGTQNILKGKLLYALCGGFGGLLLMAWYTRRKCRRHRR